MRTGYGVIACEGVLYVVGDRDGVQVADADADSDDDGVRVIDPVALLDCVEDTNVDSTVEPEEDAVAETEGD